MRFIDRIGAIGTARAREQVTLSAPVTERILRISFTDGGYVASGQVIAVLAQGEESAMLADAQARAREANQQLDRIKSLRARGFATNASLDSQVALAASARASAAQVRAQIGDRVIRAPFGGFASLRTVSAGAVVTAGTPIATISDISEIKLDFPVPETSLAAITAGQSIEVSAAAFPGETFRGTVSTIDPVIDPNTRSATVRAILANRDHRLKPGMLMTVAVETSPRVAPAVPELAIVGQGDDRFVFVLGRDGKVARTRVRTGLRSNGMVEVLEGVRSGQRVVSEGVVKVSDGMTVRVAGPADTKPPAG